MLITSAHDGIRVWDLKTGLQIHQIYRLPGYNNILINPDGSTLASCSSTGIIEVWDLKTGQLIRTVGEHSRDRTLVVVSSDWQKVLCVEYKTIYERDLNTGQLIRTRKVNLGKLSSIALTPDGQILAGGSFDNSIRIWDLRTKREIHTFKGHSQTICFLAFSPDGQTLVSAGDKTIKVWNLQTEKLIHTLTGHKHKIISVAISPDWQTLLSSGTDNTIIKWNLNMGQTIRVFKDSDTVCSLAFHNKHTFISTNKYTAKFWLPTGQVVNKLSLIGHLHYISSLAVSPDGLTIFSSGGGDKTIKLWDSRTGHIISNLCGESEAVTGFILSLDGEFIASRSEDNTIKLWNVKTSKKIGTLIGHSNSVLCLAISSNGEILASGDRDGTIKVWNLETREEMYTLQQRYVNSYYRQIGNGNVDIWGLPSA